MPQQRADWLLADQRLPPGARAERGVRKKRWSLVGVVPVDGHYQQDLALGLPGRLAHLPGDQCGQVVDPLLVQLGHPQQDLGPLVFRGSPPGLVGAGRALEYLLDLRISRGGELTLGLVGGRVDNFELAHCRYPFRLAHANIPPASVPRPLPVPGPAPDCFLQLLARLRLYISACCTKTARRASVGVRAADVSFSAAEWGDRASREARWRLGGDRFRRDPFMRQADLCIASL